MGEKGIDRGRVRGVHSAVGGSGAEGWWRGWRGVLAVAMASRAVCTLGMGVAAAVGTSYDSSARLAWDGGREAEDPGRGGGGWEGVASGWSSWDAVYLVQIARRGYVSEQEHAFFPGFPLAVRGVARVVLTGAPWVGEVLGEGPVWVLSGAAVSNACFCGAAVLLYWLGCEVTGDSALATRAAVLFCVNPASAVMSAAYTESMFACASLGGMLALERGRPAAACALFFAATATRSNGVVLAGFFLHRALQAVAAEASAHRAVRAGGGKALGRALGWAAIGTAAAAAPLALFEAYGRARFCPGRPWCPGGEAEGTFYGFVQRTYWDVGFLRYYTLQQVPNFVLAAPHLAVSVSGAWSYVRRCSGLTGAVFGRGRPKAGSDPSRGGYAGDTALPYVCYWAFLSVYAALFMHVQVVIRLLSGCPALFWYLADVSVEAPPPPGKVATAEQCRVTPCGLAVCTYCVGYGLCGLVLFSNFYPPA